ncbi:HD domain-containing protein [Aestuariispira insulae]|uniref:Phosphonate degradation associated HDIG domain protein n=1 Tax=Aestuariispira insulae TaxID=1461337 RepID=A0A3D9HGE7_9PROT|nr:HD domain-containing protein [Aestuariispira insulae]RED48572.1 phosphonate degradation associated HDIG domain protein [Aestuariispira insulae]
MIAKQDVTHDNVVDFIIDLFNDMGNHSYLGEDISQEEHGLQCAVVADQFDSPDSLIAAALLHDIGHFLHELDEDCLEQGIDNNHEDVGADFLRPFFPPEVTEPVRMHVGAKRYLCAVEPDYFSMLSPASVQSLEVQGGPMNGEEVKVFAANPHLEDALKLRRFEEAGKNVGVKTPPVEHYRPLLQSLITVNN